MFEINRRFTLVSILLVVILMIAAASRSNDTNFANTAKRELTKEEIKKKKRKEIAGGEYYLQTNLWSEEGRDILSTNFHRGNVISIGTEVRIDKFKKGSIIFTVKNSEMKHNLVLAKRHSKLNVYELFDRYFGKTNLVNDSSYKSLAKSEKSRIDQGLICNGMKKESVIMSYGYPPTHATPSVESNEWTYWESRAKRMIIIFENDKVVETIGYKFSCE